MSKLIVLPFVAAAAPFIGAVRVAKKIGDTLGALPPEDWNYLLPLGAAKERLRLEQASVTHHPLEGIEFDGALPEFANGADVETPVALHQLESAPLISFQEDVLRSFAPRIEEAGFKAERRALPEGANIAVFDLFQSGVMESVPALVGGRRGYQKD